MKKVLILLACAAAIVACSKEEPIAINQGQAISFSNPFINKATRAITEVSTATLSEFNVWGTGTDTSDANKVVIFDGTHIVKQGGVWKCEDPEDVQYWVPGADYAFTAIANHIDKNLVTLSSGMPTAIDATVSITEGANDLILAQAAVDEADADEDPVNLTFSHLMSKVGFTVTSNATGDYTHTVRNITVENFSEGTYTIGTGWGDTTDATIQFGAIEDVNNTNIAGKTNGTLLLIPNTASFKVSFVVDFEKDGTVLRTVEYTGSNAITINSDGLKPLVAGNAYNFTIALSAGNEIKFIPTVTDWNNGDPATEVPVLQ